MSINNQLSKSKIKTEESIESKEQTKNLDIFQHLKTNIHNTNTNCTCENTDEIPDIIEIDAASNNGVDEIRELRNNITLAPSMSKYKIYIIDEVHMLSTGAFNALLKTLEEPPEHAIFILATTEIYKVPITILSRCQRYDFKKISKDDMVKYLKWVCDNEKIECDNSVLDEKYNSEQKKYIDDYICKLNSFFKDKR